MPSQDPAGPSLADALPRNATLEGRAGDGPPARLPWLDALRGAAVVAMVVYHTAWDVSDLRLADIAVAGDPAWNLFARAIAATFLGLAGIGLALAHSRGFRPRAFARRLAVVAGAAGLVSATTLLAFPEAWIFFGILHNMAVSSVVAWPFLRAPAFAAAAAALGLVTAPLWLGGSPAFDAAPLVVLGLGQPPLTNDWVPVLPWTGIVLAGVAAGRLLGRVPVRPGRPGRAVRALGWLGQRSLAIYLLHQPLIYGACLGLVTLVGPNPAAETAPFRAGCARSCEASGTGAGRCRQVCACTVGALRREGLWPGVRDGTLSPFDSLRVPQLARTCLSGDAR